MVNCFIWKQFGCCYCHHIFVCNNFSRRTQTYTAYSDGASNGLSQQDIHTEQHQCSSSSSISNTSSSNSNQTENTNMPKHRTEYTHVRQTTTEPNKSCYVAYLVALVLSEHSALRTKVFIVPTRYISVHVNAKHFAAHALRSMHSTSLLKSKKKRKKHLFHLVVLLTRLKCFKNSIILCSVRT